MRYSSDDPDDPDDLDPFCRDDDVAPYAVRSHSLGGLAKCPDAGSLSRRQTFCCPVPYVIDHGAHYRGAGSPEWAAGPKPYYALFWFPPKADGSVNDGEGMTGAASGDWHFMHLPDVVTIPQSDLLVPPPFDSPEIFLTPMPTITP